MSTYSVDYVDNAKHFQAHSFQPGADGPWIQRMVDELKTDHHWIEIENGELVHALTQAMLVRDLPGMADVDSSLYLFCKEIKKEQRSPYPAKQLTRYLAGIRGSTGMKC